MMFKPKRNKINIYNIECFDKYRFHNSLTELSKLPVIILFVLAYSGKSLINSEKLSYENFLLISHSDIKSQKKFFEIKKKLFSLYPKEVNKDIFQYLKKKQTIEPFIKKFYENYLNEPFESFSKRIRNKLFTKDYFEIDFFLCEELIPKLPNIDETTATLLSYNLLESLIPLDNITPVIDEDIINHYKNVFLSL